MNKKFNIVLTIIAFLTAVTGVYLKATEVNHKEVIKVKELSPIIVDEEIVIKPLEKGFEIIRPSNKEITTTEKEFIFTGMANPNENITINDKKIDVYFTGNFVVIEKLEEGKNTFTIKSDEKTKTYVVNKINKIIKSVKPEKKIVSDSEKQITIEAKLYSGSIAYAEINGKKYEMKQVETEEYIDARETSYAKFQCKFKAPKTEKDLNLGKVKIYAKYNNSEEEIISGEILVNGSKNNTYKKIRIKNSNANVYDGNNLSYIPIENVGNLPNGMEGFAKSEVLVDDKVYFNLKSGIRVKKDDCEIISGEKINNSIENIRVYDEGDCTIIKVKEKVNGPYLLTIEGIEFKDSKNNNFAPERGKCTEIKMNFLDSKITDTKLNIDKNSIFSECYFEKNNFVLKLKNESNFQGSTPYYDKDGNLIIKFRHKLKSIKGATIVIDPGHGLVGAGVNDPGALGFNGINEQQINNDCGKKLKKVLEEKGANVILLDTSNIIYGLTARPEQAFKNDADIFLSIHSNSGGSGEYNANEVYYYNSFSKGLAKRINEEIVDMYEKKLFGGESREYDRGYKWDYFTVTLEKSCPSVLIELGYVDNPVSFNKLINKKYQEEFAIAIANGIDKYINSN